MYKPLMINGSLLGAGPGTEGRGVVATSIVRGVPFFLLFFFFRVRWAVRNNDSGCARASAMRD